MRKKFMADGLTYLTIIIGLLRLQNDDVNLPEMANIIGEPTSYLTSSIHSPFTPPIINQKIIDYDYDNLLEVIYGLNDYNVLISRQQRNLTALLLEIQNNPSSVDSTVVNQQTGYGSISDELRNIFPGTSLTKDDINLIDTLWQEDIDVNVNGHQEPQTTVLAKSAYPFVIDKLHKNENFMLNDFNTMDLFPKEIENNFSIKTNSSLNEFYKNDVLLPADIPEIGNVSNESLNLNVDDNLSSFLPLDMSSIDFDNFLENLNDNNEISTPDVDELANCFNFVDDLPIQSDFLVNDAFSDSGVSCHGSSKENEESENLRLHSNPSFSSSSPYSINDNENHENNYEIFFNNEIESDNVETSSSNYFGIAHDHTYTNADDQLTHRQLQPQRHHSVNNTKRKITNFKETRQKLKQRYDPIAVQKHCRSRDEKAANNLKIPLTMNEIIDSSVEEFNDLMSDHQELNDRQVQLIRDIRRRGKNKVAAQNCRRRKMDAIDSLEKEVLNLRQQRASLVREERVLKREIIDSSDRLRHMTRNLFEEIPRPYNNGKNPDNYTLELTKDGKPYMVQKNKKSRK